MGSNLAGVWVLLLWNRTKALFFMGSNLAGVRVLWSRTKALFFLGSKSHLHEAFFRRVFCLAWARLMLAFGCFGTEALFFMGSKGDVKHSVCVFFAWHGLESCWCFGLFESDADETLSGHRSESTFHTVFCLAKARHCWRSGVSEPKLCFFLWVPKVTWSILSACFLLGMGSNLAGVSVFSNLTRRWRRFESPSFGIHAPELWLYMCVSNVLVRHPFWCTNRVLRALILLVFRSFRIYSWQKFDSHRQESTLVFICIYLCREFGPPSLTTHASACRSAALLVQKSRLRALILLLFRSFRIWSWRQFDQPSSAIHACVRFWLVWARVELVFGCLFGSEADEDYIHFSGWLIWELLVAVFGRITSRSSALRDMFSHWVAGAPEISLQMFCSQIFLQKFLCQ